VACTSVALGCGSAGEVSEAEPVSGIYGTALYAKTVGPDHVVDFYEFGAGKFGIRESLSVDNGEVPILDGAWKFDSLADVYKRLNPAASEVPATILEADGRAVELRSRLARQNALRPVPANATSSSPPVAGEPAAGPVGASPKGESFVAAAANCSGDAYGDNWGENWFLDRYCNAGGFRWCPTNKAWANSGDYSAGWSSWRQMEGDFNVRGHILADRISCDDYWLFTSCGFRTLIIDHDVLPRHIETWTYNDGNDVFSFRGSSQCGHQHTAFLRN
jgi:hypothetical protein